MDTNTQTPVFVERRKAGYQPQERWWNLFLLAVTALLVAGYFVSTQKWYKPGDSIGYNLGLVGGVMMLAMLLYSVRKRFRFMKDRGLLPAWFQWHMSFGILAPTIIMFHSTFYIGSINAGVALVCMMLVSGSGIFGRFFYTKIHNGLYGRKITLQSMHANMEKTGSFKRAFLNFAPEIEHKLEAFRVKAEAVDKQGLWDTLSIGLQATALAKALEKELHRIMYSQAKEKNLDAAKLKLVDSMYQEYVEYLRAYISAVLDVAQFHSYERLFSWWHIFHIPLVYLLMFSGIFHVIAVHMY